MPRSGWLPFVVGVMLLFARASTEAAAAQSSTEGTATVSLRIVDAGTPQAAFLVTRIGGALDQPLDVEGEFAGGSVAGIDHQPLPRRITIPAGQSSVRLSPSVLRRPPPNAAAPAISLRLLPAERPFTFVILPDTQNYTAQLLGGTVAMLEAQIQWILDQRDALNIVCVLHAGDCTDHNIALEWQRFRGAMSRLDGVVPYVISVGNHDGAVQAVNNTALFNRYFPLGDYAGDPTFAGTADSGKFDNHCRFISAGGVDWLVFAMEFGPHNAVLDWANQLAARHPNRRVALVTHTHVATDNTLHGSKSSHTLLPVRDYKRDNDGPDVWEKFLRRQPGSALVFSGHLGGSGGKGRLVMNNDAGSPVFQMLSDFQSLALGGGGLLRIVRFFPSEDRMAVSTFSPHSGTWLRDSGNEFEYANTGLFGRTAPSYRVDAANEDATLAPVVPAQSSLANLSVRALAGSAGQSFIVGFVASGPKRLLLRGIGPSLASFGIGSVLQNPELALHAPSGALLASNDDWGGGAALRDIFASVGAFDLPVGSRDAALLSELPSGGPFTAALRTVSGGSGITLAEVYDIDARQSAYRLLNLSARSQVGTGDQVLIAGFVVGGTAPKRLLIRGVGAGLRDAFPDSFSASEVLANPMLAVFDAAGAVRASNDNWPAALAPELQKSGAFSLTPGGLDAALQCTLEPGGYTVQLTGVGATSGIALVEIYDLDP